MSTRHLFCKDCAYILDGLRDNCPECGRRFDPARPATFSRRGPRERSIRMWLQWTFRCRAAFFIIIGVFLISPMSLISEFVRAAIEASLFILPLLIIAALVTLFVAAFKLKGVLYGMGYLTMAILLTPFFGIGLVVIPNQVHSDIAEVFKTDHEEGAD